MIRHFLVIVGTLFFLAFSYGFMAPTLISYPDTMIVLGGIVYAAVVAPVITYIIVTSYGRNVINSFNKTKEEK